MGAAYRFWLEWVTCAGLGLCLFGVIGVLLLRTTAAGLSGSAFLTKQRASGFSLGTLTPLLVVGFLLAGLWWATLRGFGGFGAAG